MTVKVKWIAYTRLITLFRSVFTTGFNGNATLINDIPTIAVIYKP